jgi:hypothetical protein
MGLAQGMVRGDQAGAAHQPVDERLHRQGAATHLRVGDDDAGLHDVARRDLETHARRDDLQVHLRVGQFHRLEAGTFQPLQDGQHVLSEIEVVQPPVAVRLLCTVDASRARVFLAERVSVNP